MTSVGEHLRMTTSRQHGLVHRGQLAAMGATPRAVNRMVAAGVLEWCTPRVLRLRGSARTDVQALLVPALDAGRRAALSHTCGLALWGTRGFSLRPVHVVRHREDGDHPVRGAIVHEVRFLPRSRIRVLDGIPVVSPALALLQVAGMRSVSDARFERAIDAAWSDRLVSYTTLTAIDREMSRQGRRGLTRFRDAVERRGVGYVPPASNLESRFAELVAATGRPPFRRQVHIAGEDGWIGRVDFRAEDAPLVVEIQSERFHRGLVPENDDRQRRDRLEAAGIEVLEVTDVDLFHHAEEVLDALDAAYDRARMRAAA